MENSSFSEIVLDYNQFLLNAPSQTILDVLQDSKYANVSVSATNLAQLFQVLLQACSDIFKHYSNTHAYSEPSISLTHSKPWHISITKHIQTLRYIHNTILNIFTKAQSCTFDTVLNALVFFRCYLTSRVTLRYL